MFFIRSLVILLFAILLAAFATASPIEQVSSSDVNTASTSAIGARDGVTNGWTNWYQTCSSCSLDPVQYVGWSNNPCQPVPESSQATDPNWTSDYTQWIQPSQGSNARCWTYTDPDCKGKQSKQFDSTGTYTGQLYGKHYKLYQGFKCTCDDKCVVAGNDNGR